MDTFFLVLGALFVYDVILLAVRLGITSLIVLKNHNKGV